MGIRRRAQDVELAGRLLRIGHERRDQRPRGRELGEQQLDALGFRHLRVVAAGGGAEQLGQGALVHLRILPQVDAREVEAEHFHRAPQGAQSPARDQRRAVGEQGTIEHVEIGAQLGGLRVGLRLRHRVARQHDLTQSARGRDQPRIDADDGLPVRLGGAARRVIGQPPDQLLKLRRDAHAGTVERKLGTEQMQLVEVEVDDALALHLDRLTQHLGVDERIAVAVAPDPASHADEGWQLGVVPAGIDRRQPVLEVAVEPRQFAQEGVVVIRKPARDLVDHGGAAAPQQAGLPEREDGARHGGVGGAGLRRREKRTVALGEEVRHLVLPIQHALAPDLGGMRGQHGAHQDRIEQCL